ncbi:MAG: class I SAM-dependent methyltransferase [Acidobacteriota bacterium]|nr:class I SAM-dependent methyltransferase [Acidobacteriota bacterium]
MQPSFLQSYLAGFHRIYGWFSFDAALMFMAYNQLNREAGISGDVLEIGVYHGLSSIAVAALRGDSRRLYAIDLFEELGTNEAYGAGASYRQKFEDNVKSFYGTLDFVVPIASASSILKSADFPHSFSFCHVDGGHSSQETYQDLKFASELLLPGGLLALDDYFNPQHPGVCEGAVDFFRGHAAVLNPLAIGHNKVLFQKLPAAFDLNAEFSKTFPTVQYSESTMWDVRALLFGTPLRSYFDLYASTPERLALLGDGGVRATFSPVKKTMNARPGQACSLPVVVKNTSKETFPDGARVLGLSYHLLSEKGQTIRHDNPRSYLNAPLKRGEEVKLNLNVEAPATPGHYQLEVDLVWEGVMWFKDAGNPACLVELEVR